MSHCGNPDCKASSSISEHLTFGSGELDEHGFWEHPCPICARAFEKEYPKYAPCWPFTDEQLKEMGLSREPEPKIGFCKEVE